MAANFRFSGILGTAVRLTDPFWMSKRAILLRVTLPLLYEQLKHTDRLENFRRAANSDVGGFKGIYFNDSDVYKFAEACAYSLGSHDLKGLASECERVREMFDECVTLIEAAQCGDGYLNTYFQIMHPEMRWRNLGAMHELYCAGHLMEAAVAAKEWMGDDRLMRVALRCADNISTVFGPEKRIGYCGHEEVELALIRLGRASGRQDLIELAKWMVDSRGSRPSPLDIAGTDPDGAKLSPWMSDLLRRNGTYDGSYAQDHAPVIEHTRVEGHAVRAMYLYTAAAMLDDDTYDQALHRTWNNLVRQRMYITGGIGPSAHNEGFTVDYDLPNLSSYAETCAACGLVGLGNALLQRYGSSEFADVMERALYNGMLAGIALGGDLFFYANPHESRGTHCRVPWFHCACCPPNVARYIARITDFAVGVNQSEFWIHMPIGLQARTRLNGVDVEIEVRSQYPWEGTFEVHVAPEAPVRFALRVRIPDWAEDVTTELDGATEEADYDNGYMVFDRTWTLGETLKVEMEMPPRWVESHPKVRENLGRAALTQGPIVFALEEPDLGCAPQLFSAYVDEPIERVLCPLDEAFTALSVHGQVDLETFSDDLYADLGTVETKQQRATFIPYFAWANRGPSSMQIWTRQA